MVTLLTQDFAKEGLVIQSEDGFRSRISQNGQQRLNRNSVFLRLVTVKTSNALS